MSGTSDGVLAAAITVLGGGSGKFLYDLWRDRRTRPARGSVVQRRQADIDASILTVARARDELEADNQALRQMLTEERENFRREREEWASERADLRREVDELQQKLWRISQRLDQHDTM